MVQRGYARDRVRCISEGQGEYSDLIQGLRTEAPILLSGSAISLFPPTLHPTGQEVTEAVVDFLFRDSTSRETGSRWPAWFLAHARELPFEAVFDAHPRS